MQKHSKEYTSYMKSDAWAQKREERLQLDDGKCVMCGRPQGTLKDGRPVVQCHHIHYNSLGAETMDALVSLCGGCHRKIHRYYKRFRSWEDRKADNQE